MFNSKVTYLAQRNCPRHFSFLQRFFKNASTSKNDGGSSVTIDLETVNKYFPEFRLHQLNSNNSDVQIAQLGKRSFKNHFCESGNGHKIVSANADHKTIRKCLRKSV